MDEHQLCLSDPCVPQIELTLHRHLLDPLTKKVQCSAQFWVRGEVEGDRAERNERKGNKEKEKISVSAKQEKTRSHEISIATHGLQVFLQTKG